jgi:hypothetical protein
VEADLQHQVDLLHHAPVGTCLEVAPGFWRVRGKTGSYELSEKEGTCNCPHFEHRLKQNGESCKHLTILREFLSRGDKTCPLCKGETCQGCERLGRVSSEVFPILLAIRRAEDEARVALLKEIFA